MADVILHFSKEDIVSTFINANIDVKATSQDIPNSGKSPNITSFSKIRTIYVSDPDYIFIILSLKHKVFSTKNLEGMTMGIMEITQSNSYDLKYISSSDISYNPALGSGQIQLRDVHYVSLETRNVWEFCQILDRKCIASKKGFAHWFAEAKKHGWIKSATGLYEY